MGQDTLKVIARVKARPDKVDELLSILSSLADRFRTTRIRQI